MSGKKGVKTPLNFAANREKFMNELGRGAAIIPSNILQIRNRDVHHSFRQDSDFYYLTGIVEPEAICVIAPSRKVGKFVLFIREKDPLNELWNGRHLGTAGAKAFTGADEVYPIEEFDSKISEILKDSDRLFYKLGIHRKFDSKISDWINRARRLGAPRNGWPLRSVEDPEKILGDIRLIKTEAELERLNAAIEITKDAHIRAMSKTKPGVFEFHLQAEIIHEFLMNGSERAGYEPIVGAGENATILHYIENNMEVQDGDLVLIDAGCEIDHYTADITRTYPANGKFTEAQRKLYEVVLKANEECIAMVKPGVSFVAIHERAVEVLFEGYKGLGLFPDEDLNWAREHYREFYPHNTGHWLGLDVHDVGVYRSEQGESRLLEPGMVFTIEPGVYVREDGLGKREPWKPYLGIGIRIEDNILVTEDGHENLSSDIPKSIVEIEALVGTAFGEDN